MTSYVALPDGGMRCKLCGTVTYRAEFIEARFCPCCHLAHDHAPKLLLLAQQARMHCLLCVVFFALNFWWAVHIASVEGWFRWMAWANAISACYLVIAIEHPLKTWLRLRPLLRRMK